jgi:hypothetical protein
MTVFSQKLAVLGTRHGKLPAIGPTLEAQIGLRVGLVDTVDTDRFGTFTRDVPRAGTQREAARAKALAAIEASGSPRIGLASEGSFGPHPAIPFAAGGVELVLLVDAESGLELAGWDVTADTNFGFADATSLEDALSFAGRAGFPTHGLVVMVPPGGRSSGRELVAKGVREQTSLERAVTETIRAHGSVRVETDMRAHMNPTRMRSIARASLDLARVARSLCPDCGRPGYVVVERVPGLPCADCGAPTSRALHERLSCAGCGREERRRIAVGPTGASPFECQECNP